MKSETEYVEMAFWSGWLDALGYALSEEELCAMSMKLRDHVSALVCGYVSSIDPKESEVCDSSN